MKNSASNFLYLWCATALAACTIHYSPTAQPPATSNVRPTPKPAAKRTPPKPTVAKKKPTSAAVATVRPRPRRTASTRPLSSAATLPPNSSTYAERAPLAGFSIVERATATDVGRGFDSISGRLGRSGCVDVLNLPPHGIRGARTSVDMMYVRNGYQLMDAVNVGAQASGLINVLSLGGKASYANSQSTTSDSEYLVLRIVVEGEKVTGKNFRISETAKKLLSTNQRAKFYELCGDQFVAGYVPGIEFLAVAQVARNSVREEVTKSFGFSAGFPVLASIDIETARSVYKEATGTLQSVHVFAAGGDGTAEISIDIDELLAQPTKFLPKATASPAVLQLALENYSAVEGLPTRVSLLTHPLARQHLDALIQRQRLAALQKLTTDAFARHWAWWQGKLKDVTVECSQVDYGWLWSDWQTVCREKEKPVALDGCQVAWLLDKRYQELWNGNSTIARQACPAKPPRKSPRNCEEVRSAIARAPDALRESVLRCLEQPGRCRTELEGAMKLRMPTNAEYYQACRPPLTAPTPIP